MNTQKTKQNPRHTRKTVRVGGNLPTWSRSGTAGESAESQRRRFAGLQGAHPLLFRLSERSERRAPVRYERLGTEGGRARSRGACDESSLQPPSCGGETTYKNRQKTDRVAACGHPMVHPLVQALVHPAVYRKFISRATFGRFRMLFQICFSPQKSSPLRLRRFAPMKKRGDRTPIRRVVAAPHHQPRMKRQRIQGCVDGLVHWCGFSYAASLRLRGTFCFVSPLLLWTAIQLARLRFSAVPESLPACSKTAPRQRTGPRRSTKSAYSGRTTTGKSGRRPARSVATTSPSQRSCCKKPGTMSLKLRTTVKTTNNPNRWVCVLTGPPILDRSNLPDASSQGRSVGQSIGFCRPVAATATGNLFLSPSCHESEKQLFETAPDVRGCVPGYSNHPMAAEKALQYPWTALRRDGHWTRDCDRHPAVPVDGARNSESSEISPENLRPFPSLRRRPGGFCRRRTCCATTQRSPVAHSPPLRRAPVLRAPPQLRISRRNRIASIEIENRT